MEVNGKKLELIEVSRPGDHIGEGIPPQKWEIRKEGIKVGLIFDRDVAKALGAKV